MMAQDFPAVLPLIQSRDYLSALNEIVNEKMEMRSQFPRINPSYDRQNVVDFYREDFGRDDVGNAVGGARVRDQKIDLYLKDFRLSRIERYICEQIGKDFRHGVTDDKFSEAI